jgi:hypothetical protein
VGQLQRHANRLEELVQAAARGPSSKLGNQASHWRALIRSISVRSHRRRLVQQDLATKRYRFAAAKVGWEGKLTSLSIFTSNPRQLVSHSAACAGPTHFSKFVQQVRLNHHASHVAHHTSHAIWLTSHFSPQGYNSVCTLNITCSGDIHTNDIDYVVARWFTSIAETTIDTGIPRDETITHGGAIFGTMPKDVEWMSAESAVVDEVLLPPLLLMAGMIN